MRPEMAAARARAGRGGPAAGRAVVRAGRRADPLGRIAGSQPARRPSRTRSGSAAGSTCSTRRTRSGTQRSGPRSVPSSGSAMACSGAGVGGEPGQDGDLYPLARAGRTRGAASSSLARRVRGRRALPADRGTPRRRVGEAQGAARAARAIAARRRLRRRGPSRGPSGGRVASRAARRRSSRGAEFRVSRLDEYFEAAALRPPVLPGSKASCAGRTGTPGRSRACTPPARRSSDCTPRRSWRLERMAEPLAALALAHRGRDATAAARPTPGARCCARSSTTRSAAAPRTRWRIG